MAKKKKSQVLVDIIEYDRWSGPTVESTRKFKTRSLADTFRKKFNAEHCPPNVAEVPDYFVAARIRD